MSDENNQPERKKIHTILDKSSGKLRARQVSDEEFHELNKPKFSKKRGKADPLNEMDCGPFGTNIRNKVFGNI